MTFLLMILCRLIILVTFVITLQTSNNVIMKVSLWGMFICSQYLLRISIHDFFMLKEIRKTYILSYWKQPDLIVRVVISLMAFYYDILMYLRFDIALSVTCFVFFNFLFYKIFKAGPTQADLRDAHRVVAYKNQRSRCDLRRKI